MSILDPPPLTTSQARIALLRITPESQGAVGDGIANDSGPLAAAASAAATFGLELALSSTYKVGSTWVVPAGLRVVSTGLGKITGAVVSGAVMSVGSNTTIDGIEITNTAGGGGNIGLTFRAGAKTVRILRCRFTGGALTQSVYLAVAGISDAEISGCYFDGVAYGVLSNDGANDLTGLRVVGNHFTNIHADAVELNHPFGTNGDGTRATCSGFVVSRNIISVPEGLGSGSGSGFGIGAAGVTGLAITDNIILTARNEGIHIEDDTLGVTVTGNVVVDAVSAGIALYLGIGEAAITANSVLSVTDGPGIMMVNAAAASPTTGVTITANTIRGASGTGISVGGQGGGRITVAANPITGCGSHGIAILGSADLITITDNPITGCAGYGVYRNPQVNVDTSVWRVAGNLINGCTLGDYNGVAISVGVATQLTDRMATFVSGLSVDSLVSVPLYRLGRYADGHVRFTARRGSSGRGDTLFRVRWDGATLNMERLSRVEWGVHTESGLSVVDGVLTCTVNVGGDGLTIAGHSCFDGVILEDGATFSGTVTSTPFP